MFVIPMLNLPTSSSFRWVLLDQYARRGKYSPMVQGCVAMTGLSLIRLDPPDAIAFSSTQVGQQSSVLRVTNVGTSRIAFKVPLLQALLATVARNGEPRSKK